MSDEADVPTSKVLFENHQWRVTAYGVGSIEPAPTYELPAKRFLEIIGPSSMIGRFIWLRRIG